jgi:hypothetical protein
MPERAETDAYHALCAYSLAHRGAGFIHQHVVDAFAAQHADHNGKPIGIAFALVGLYLMIEKGFSGIEVQRAHIRLGRHKRVWPSFQLPTSRGSVTAVEVMAKPEGPERDRVIHAWCASVWSGYTENRDAVEVLLREYGIV